MKGDSRAIERSLTNLDTLLTKSEAVQWQVGDELIVLVDQLGVPLKDIAARYNGAPGRSYSRLSQYYSTAKAFPPAIRHTALPFEWHDQTRQSIRRINRAAANELPEANFTMNPKDALAIVAGANVDGGARDITGVLRDAVREQLLPQHKAIAEDKATIITAVSPSLINACHHSDYLKVLEQMPLDAIQLGHLDPPYAHYGKTPDGSCHFGMNTVAQTSCDNASEEEAVATTCAAFPLLATRLRKRGAIILWQAGRHLRIPIIDAIESNGLEIRLPWVWWKRGPMPGDYDTPNMYSTEFAWLICRRGEYLTNLDGSSRDQVQQFAIEHQRADWILPDKDRHGFEKPAAWNEFFLGKLTSPGDLVFDAFGCTGSMPVAAIKMNRRWVYCESNAENFRMGQARIQRALETAGGQSEAA